ncbi:MAG TPA: LytR C-terminal domain-containing protein [Kribbella sp.]
MPRSTDDKGQVLSSFAAVAAVVAIVAGLLVLFGTRGDNSAAGSKPNSMPAAKTSFSHPTSAPATTPGPPSTTPSHPTPSQPTPSQPTVGSTPIPTAELPMVVVFNNTKRKGLADQVATKARAVGWRVAGADNWHGKVVTSTVYYPAGLQAEAAQLAKVLGIGRIKDALPNMKQDRLSVILTADYAG